MCQLNIFMMFALAEIQTSLAVGAFHTNYYGNI